MAKDFKSAMKGQRTSQNNLGVVGEVSPLRAELERAAEQLPIQEIAIVRLQDNPYQKLARPSVDEEGLDELADSIRQNGFYGALLARRKRGITELYELAYGHRRREAAKRAGLENLPVKIVDLDDTQMARIMASENFSREDLAPLGQANVIGHLYTAQNMSIEKIASVIGKKRGWVQPRLALYNAPNDIKEMVEQKPEAMSHVRLLVQLDNPVARAPLIQAILADGLTFEQLGEKVKELKNQAEHIAINFTNHRNDVDSETSHNVSRENKTVSTSRLEALLKVDKAVARFERLASVTDYKLSPNEKKLLKDILERLAPFLD
jgi:ParB/RepB/Spo0J family partition protein